MYTEFAVVQMARVLNRLPRADCYMVAYSGGCDSHVLLHILANARKQGLLPMLRAVHIDHGLLAASTLWVEHCASICSGLNIPLHSLRVRATPEPGESPEAAARHARYRAISSLMSPGECLLTAHHQDDQAETLLLQLLRGSGPHGLAAMPGVTAFPPGLIARPLLDYSRQDLFDYAQHHGLQWIDDPSNFDTGFDRNYLRREIMPRLYQRWPGAARTLSRSAWHAAQAARILDSCALQDLQRAQGHRADILNVDALLALDEANLHNVLRYWIKSLGLPLPDTVQLEHIISDVLHARVDTLAVVKWPGAEARRYREWIYVMPPLAAHDPGVILSWDMRQPLRLPAGGALHALSAVGVGVKKSLCDAAAITVRFRQGGEVCKPSSRAATRTLKNLFQEAGIPPWERNRVPLIYIGDTLACVAGYWVCMPCLAVAGEAGINLVWKTE